MSGDAAPLSGLVTQGWEVVHYSASIGNSGTLEHHFLLRKSGRHKVLMVRDKMMGEGVVSEERDI